MSFANTIAQTDVAKSWLKETLAVCAILFIAAIIFSALPMEVKGTLIISATLVVGYLIIRALGGGT